MFKQYIVQSRPKFGEIQIELAEFVIVVLQVKQDFVMGVKGKEE